MRLSSKFIRLTNFFLQYFGWYYRLLWMLEEFNLRMISVASRRRYIYEGN